MTASDLVLDIQTWRDPKFDKQFHGRGIYRWDASIQGPENLINAIKSVTYRLDSSYPDPVRETTDRHLRFKMGDVSWENTTVYADVKVSQQKELITLSKTIDLSKAIQPHPEPLGKIW